MNGLENDVRRLGYVPGYKTSEFWITAITYIISLLNLTGAWNYMSNWHSGILMVVATSAYKVARGLVKAGALRAPNYPGGLTALAYPPGLPTTGDTE